jgi:sec-independent protein translocase protein TatC
MPTKEQQKLIDNTSKKIEETGKKINNEISKIITDERKEMAIEFLKSLKGPLKRVFLTFIIFIAIGGIFSIELVNFFTSLVPENIELVAFSPTEVFVTVLTIVIGFSIVFTFPIFLIETIKFIMPALFEEERKLILSMLPISIFLFIIGAIFGIWIMAFFGLIFFANFAAPYGITNLWSLSGVMSTFLVTAIGFGIAFQLPIVVIILVKNNFITIDQLKSIRKYLIVFLLIISAILTPPDVISQIAMALPLYFLFEVTLIYLKVTNNKSK